MANKDWQVGPVLKDKPGSQGTLFRGGTKFSSDARFPKGYTPERQAEVAEAVVQPSIHHSLAKDHFGQVKDVRTGMASAHFKDRKVRGSGDMSSTDNLYNESRGDVRGLVDNIARSTVPVEHLNGVQFRTNVSQDRLGHPTTAGHYDTKGDAMTNGGPVIRLGPGYENQSATIHEIGHHVSNIEGNEWRKNYSFASPEGGHEEAFADNYADTHFRDRKGRPAPRGIYGGGPYGGVIQRTDEFWGGYRRNRHYAPDAEIAAENKKYFEAFPEEQEHPDGSVDQPLIHREREYGGYVNGKQQHRDVVAGVNEDALPSHANHDWSKYHV